jgi:hypothetical protein
MVKENDLIWGNQGDEEFERLSKITIGKLNQIQGGLSQKGRIPTEEEKNLKSEIMKGVNKGRVRTEETRKKMSESHMGRVSPNKGKVLTEEWKKKISEAGTKPYAIYNGEEYTCMELTIELGMLNSKTGEPNPSKLSYVKSGRSKNKWGIVFL